MGRLEKVVDRWVRKITSVTTLEHDPSQGPVIEEKNFWLAIEQRLSQVDAQIKNNSMIDVTLKLL